MRLIRPSLLALTLAGCSGADQPYYTSRDAFYSAVDDGTSYARWCGRQSDETTCAPVVVKIVSLQAIARTEIFNADARADSGSKTGVGIAQLAARAAIRQLSEYVAAHPIADSP